MATKPLWLNTLGLSCLLASLLPGSAGAAGQVYLVIGSDTALWNYPSNAPNTVDAYQFSSYYKPDLLIATNGVSFQVMDPAFRSRFTDSYGQALKLTWWMMGGNVFRYASNLNVPTANTMTLHLMQQYHGAAIRQFGDELSLHYHTFAWNDPNGDGLYHWNQSRTFLECKDDFDFTLAQYLVEEEVFPVSFRSGWHFMDNDWQAYLDQLLPYNLDDDYGVKRAWTTNSEPIAGVEDWSKAVAAFIPFHPSSTNYQTPGDGQGWNVRSVKIQNLTSNLMNQIFSAAAGGTDQVACLWSHLPEDFLNQVIKADAMAHGANSNYPSLMFRYCTAVEAMQRWRGITDQTAPELAVTETTNGETISLTLQTSEPIWQAQPFVALKDIWQQYQILACTNLGSNTWSVVLPQPKRFLAKLGLAVTDLAGNLTTRIIRFQPDDVYVDNLDPEYQEMAGNWTRQVKAAWGTDSRIALLSSNDNARVQWRLPVTRSGRYQLSLQVPLLTNSAGDSTFNLYTDGSNSLSTVFGSPFPPYQWIAIGALYLDQNSSNILEMVVSGTNQAGRYAVADVLKIAFLPDTNRPPVAVAYSTAASQNSPLEIPVSDILSKDFDPDGDSLNFLADSTSAQGGSAALTNSNVLLYLPPPNYLGGDSVAYTITDGRGGSASSTVEIQVLAGPLPGRNQLLILPGTNGWALRFRGLPGATCQVQRSVDLSVWEEIATLTVPPDGILEYEDSNAPVGAGFYRIALPASPKLISKRTSPFPGSSALVRVPRTELR